MKKAIFGAILALAASAAFSFEAQVVSVSGKAEIQRGGTWQVLTAGMTAQKGDTIQTGFKSEVILAIKGTTVTMNALSRLTVEQLAEKDTKDETRLYLNAGSLKSDVKQSENRRVGFTVRSPVATASVRGTVLEVQNKFAGTNVSTLEGTVAVWKSAVPEAELTSEEEDNEAAAPASDGSAASDIASQAPRGAVTVSAGHAVGIAGGDVGAGTPQSRAASEAANLPSLTGTLAANEAVNLAPPSGIPADKEPVHVRGAQTASIVITATFPED